MGREAFGARGATGTSILITLQVSDRPRMPCVLRPLHRDRPSSLLCRQLFGFMVAYLIVVGNMLQSVMKLLPHAEASLCVPAGGGLRWDVNVARD